MTAISRDYGEAWVGLRDIVRRMPTADVIAATAPLITDIGSRFMLNPMSNEIGAAAGFTHPFQFYATGRGGVLGDVDADVVISAFGFFAPGLVRKFWESGSTVMAPRAAGTLFATAAQAWGRANLGSLDGMERLAELGEKVIDAADASALALFAGWRAEALPDDATGRAYQVLHVLREHRGSAHIVAVLASGLRPFEAKVGKDGRGAKSFGWAEWKEDLLDIGAVQTKLARAEALTDELVTPAYSVLSEDESADFIELVATVHAALPPR